MTIINIISSSKNCLMMTNKIKRELIKQRGVLLACRCRRGCNKGNFHIPERGLKVEVGYPEGTITRLLSKFLIRLCCALGNPISWSNEIWLGFVWGGGAGELQGGRPFILWVELFEGSHRLSSFMSFPNLAGFCSAVKDHVPLYLTLLFYFFFPVLLSYQNHVLSVTSRFYLFGYLRHRIHHYSPTRAPLFPLSSYQNPFFTIYQPCITFIVICFYYQISVFWLRFNRAVNFLLYFYL